MLSISVGHSAPERPGEGGGDEKRNRLLKRYKARAKEDTHA